MNIVSFFTDGGAWMLPIGVCSVVGGAITAERFIVLTSSGRINKKELLNRLKSEILKGDLDRAIAFTSKDNSPLTTIVREGLKAVKSGGSVEEVQTAMDAVALKEVPELEKRIGLLATVSNIATLFGLLGTVMGLIGAFADVANIQDPQLKNKALTQNIAVAMHTTAFGLIVAIPLLGAYGWLMTKSQQIVDELHEASVSILNFVLANRDRLK